MDAPEQLPEDHLPAESQLDQCLLFDDPAWDDAFGTWTDTLRVCCE